MDLQQIDQSIATAEQRLQELATEQQALEQLRGEVGADISLKGDEFRQLRVRAKAEGTKLNGAGDKLGMKLTRLQDQEAQLVREIADTDEALHLVKRQLVTLAEQREFRMKQEIFPQYKAHLESSEAELLQAIARRLVVIARTNGVAVGGTNPQRVIEKVLGDAQASRTWQAHIDQAIQHFLDSGMEA